MQTRGSWTCPLLLLVVLAHGFFATGCGDATSATEDEPLHHHVFCKASADGQSVTCDESERLAAFNAWVQEALYRPQSTFTMWAVGTDHSSSRAFFTACIPDKWPPPSVWQAKASFLQQARQGVRANRTEQSVPARCSPDPNAPGSHQLVVFSPSTSLNPDIWQRVPSAPVAPPIHLSIVCDLSASTLEVACNTAALLRSFDFWIAEGLARPGSTLTVAVVGSSRDTMRTLYHLNVPERSAAERVAFLLGARVQLGSLLKSESFAQNASAIIEAIHAAVTALRERQGRYYLVVLSDLRQLTPEWDFDQTIPRSDAFLTWLKTTRLLADLRNTQVLICGIHSHRSPGRALHTATRAAALHDLWQAVFQAAGAPEVKLFTNCEAGFAASKT
jgi:hypothetical protein